jgi:hypothetical protein
MPPVSLDRAVHSYKIHVGKWPGLAVYKDIDHILVKMQKPLNIYIPSDWQGWPIKVSIISQ